MIILIGLLILVAAVVVGVGGVLANGGGGHALTHDGFAVFGYHVTGSTGLLFFYGMVVGALGLLGLSLLLAGARRTARRGRTARRDLKQSRLETASVSRHRDDLVEQQHETTNADATPIPGGSPERVDQNDHRTYSRDLLHAFRRRLADRQPASAARADGRHQANGNVKQTGADPQDAVNH